MTSEIETRKEYFHFKVWKRFNEKVYHSTITAEDRIAQEKGLTDFLKSHIKNPSLALLLDSIPYTTEDEKQAPSRIRQWDVELLKSEASSHEAVAKAIERITRETLISNI